MVPEPTVVRQTDEYEIRASAFPILVERIHKLAAKAVKLQTPAPSVLLVSSRRLVNEDTGKITELITVRIAGTEPIIAGFMFLGTIIHGDVGNVIRLSPSAQKLDPPIDTTPMRGLLPWCDHCETYRARKETYIVKHVGNVKDLTPINASKAYNIAISTSDTGIIDYKLSPKLMQVGSSCLKDFLGHGDPHALVNYLERVQELLADIDDEDFGGSGGDSTIWMHTSFFLSHVAAMVRVHGWLSKTKAADDGGVSTADRAEDNIHRINNGRAASLYEEPPISPTDADKAAAEATIAYLRDHILSKPVEARSDYEQNLVAATFAQPDCFNMRNAGIVASAVYVYNRWLGDQQERANRLAAKGASEHLFNVKDRLTLRNLKVERAFTNDGDYGVSYKYVLRDPLGNAYTWGTQNDALEIGDTIVITGTVKANDVYERTGEKQTALTRCRLDKIVRDGVEL